MSQLSLVDQKRIELYLADKLRRVPPELHSTSPRSFNSPAALSFSQELVFHRAEHNTDKPPFYNEWTSISLSFIDQPDGLSDGPYITLKPLKMILLLMYYATLSRYWKYLVRTRNCISRIYPI
jgi:hypothetical protein